jgi:PTS system mannose-specific IIC component
MDFPILPILVMGAIVGLDTTAAFQVMISQPLVACSLLGWMMGDPVMGWMVGMTTQLLWMGKLPVGAATFPDGNMGSLVAAGLGVIFRNKFRLEGIGVLVALAVLWGLITAWIGGWVIVGQRKLHTRWVGWFDRQALDGNLRRYSLGYTLIIAWNGLVGAVEALVFFSLGYGILHFVIPLLPDSICRVGFVVPYLLLGIGLIQILVLFGLRRWWLIVGGLVAGVIFMRIG